MKGVFAVFYNFYPEKEVKAGDSWDKNYSFKASDMNVDTKNAHTLQYIQNDKAKI
jgi:hypothetical protein